MRSKFPRSIERLFGRLPHLFAFWLELRNRVLRSVARPRIAAAAIATTVIAVVAVVLGVGLLAPLVPTWIDYLDAHASWLMALLVLQAATTVARRRTRLSAVFRTSWLASTPRSVLTRRASLMLVVLRAPIAHLVLLVSLLLLYQHVAASDAVVPHLITVVVGSYAAGILLGFVISRRQHHDHRPGSRYIPGRKANSSSRAPASLSALARWPIASAFAWATPDTVRWPVMAAMLSVMSGSSALGGLLVVGFWMVIVYMVTLFTSTLRVAQHAANWLRSTPLSFGRFAMAICCRSMLHQLLATSLIAALIAAETRAPLQSVLLVAPWMALVLVAYSTTVAYSFKARRGARASMALSAIVIAVFESFYRGAAIPMALFVCVWQFRLGAHANNGSKVPYVT